MASIVEKYEELLAAARGAALTSPTPDDPEPAPPAEVVALNDWVDALPDASRALLDRVASFGACSTDRPRIARGVCKGTSVEIFQAGMQKALDAAWDLSEILWQA